MKVGFLDEVLADMKAGVYDFTKDGKCSNCGQCCADLLPISDEEVRKIRAYIKRNNIKEQRHFLPTVLVPAFDLTCPFRSNAERKCVIYEVRPAICRDFQCDKPRKQIEADKAIYHGLYFPRSMRATFFINNKINNKGE